MSGHNPTDMEIREIMQETDTDRDDFIDFPEFLTMMARTMKAHSKKTWIQKDIVDAFKAENIRR